MIDTKLLLLFELKVRQRHGLTYVPLLRRGKRLKKCQLICRLDQKSGLGKAIDLFRLHHFLYLYNMAFPELFKASIEL